MEENWLNDEYVAYYNQNYATEADYFRQCLNLLKIGPDDRIIDLGCGNGEFLSLAAPLAQKVYGLDISRLQIELAQQNLGHFSNIELICAPFTTYQPQPNTFTKGFSRKALHHLTDAEKALFAQNVGPAFQSGALLYIEDGIFFEFERPQLMDNWERLKEQAAQYYGSAWKAKEHDVMNSFLNEFPCGVKYWQNCWERVGFKLIKVMPKSSFYGGIMLQKS